MFVLPARVLLARPRASFDLPGSWSRAFAWMFVLAVVAGCPARPAARALPPLERAASPNPRAESDFRAAADAAAAGKIDDAYQRFRAFLDVWSEDPLEPFARLELGRIDLARGKNAEAKLWFEGVATTRDVALSERGELYGAVASQRLGQHQQALFVLRPMMGRTVDPTETLLVLDTIAEAEEALGDMLSALTTRDRELSVQLPEEQRRGLERRVQDMVDHLEPALELPRAYDTLPHDGFAWPAVARRLLMVSHERGDREKVQAIAGAMESEGITLDEDLRALVLRAERSSDADPGVVGVILPLSGRGREVGEAALRGLMLAAGAPDNKGPRLVYRDDAGDPQKALEALEDLASLHRVIAVIGPVNTPSAQAVAGRARALGVPMIALSPDRSLTQEAGAVFRVLPEPGEESFALVRHAVATGARRFAILAPEGAFGSAMRSAFEGVIQAQGGSVAGTVTYPVTATSFVKEAEAVSRLSFDALVLADAPNRVALLAPALASKGVWSAREARATATETVALFLVPSFGFDASLARSSRRYLQRAVFSVPFEPGRSPNFTSAFRGAYQAEPNLFAAVSYDAYRLLSAALGTGASTREAAGKALAGARIAMPVAATDGFAPGRGPRVPSRLMTLNGEAFVELAPGS